MDQKILLAYLIHCIALQTCCSNTDLVNMSKSWGFLFTPCSNTSSMQSMHYSHVIISYRRIPLPLSLEADCRAMQCTKVCKIQFAMQYAVDDICNNRELVDTINNICNNRELQYMQ